MVYYVSLIVEGLLDGDLSLRIYPAKVDSYVDNIRDQVENLLRTRASDITTYNYV